MTHPQDAPRDLDVPLLAGERVLWTGGPDPAKLFEPADVFIVPFSVAWGGFAIFWMVMALSMGAPLPFAMFGLPFVVLGLHLMVGRFFVRRWQRRRTTYVLTDRRALVIRGGTVHAEPAGNGPSRIRASGDGRHLSVEFDSARAGTVLVGRWRIETDERTPGVAFEAVADVAGLRAALARSAASPQDR